MNLITLVFKQMRQRALSTVLTALSVALGAALASAVLTLQREGDELLGQQAFGYQLVVGPRAGALGLVLNTSYGIGPPAGTIGHDVYRELAEGEWSPLVASAVPLAVGDRYEGLPVVATTPKLFGLDDEGGPLDPDRRFEVTPGVAPTLAAGRPFHPRKFEAVLGGRAAAAAGLAIGDEFRPTHGSAGEDVHDEAWAVVGVLRPTGTALDRQIFIPLVSSYAIADHADAMAEQTAARADHHDYHDHGDHAGHDHAEAYHLHDGEIHLELPPAQWRLSAVLVRAVDGTAAAQLQWRVNNSDRALAAFPGVEMRRLFDELLAGPGWVLFGVAALVVATAAVSVLVGIYNSVIARRGEIAVLRALGATRGRILAMLTLEAALIGVLGAAAGFVGGKLLAVGASTLAARRLGRGIDWWTVGAAEIYFLLGVVVLAALAGVLPALAAYRTSVGDHLGSS